MIVVGVVNRDRTRDLYATRADFRAGNRVIPFPTSGNADQFLEFVARELIPWTMRANVDALTTALNVAHGRVTALALRALSRRDA